MLDAFFHCVRLFLSLLSLRILLKLVEDSIIMGDWRSSVNNMLCDFHSIQNHINDHINEDGKHLIWTHLRATAPQQNNKRKTPYAFK